MSKLIIQALDASNKMMFEGEFDGDTFFEGVFVQVSDKLGLTKPTVEMLANTREAFVLRRNRRLTMTEKRNVFTKLTDKNLTSDDDDIVNYGSDIANVLVICNMQNEKTYYKKRVNGCLSLSDIIDCFRKLRYGNIEDINELFEENERSIKDVSALKFIKEMD